MSSFDDEQRKIENCKKEWANSSESQLRDIMNANAGGSVGHVAASQLLGELETKRELDKQEDRQRNKKFQQRNIVVAVVALLVGLVALLHNVFHLI